MLLRSSSGGRYIIEATEDELLTLNNVLNEICNGVHIDEAEFATRLGATRDEVRRLLRSVNAALKGIGPIGNTRGGQSARLVEVRSVVRGRALSSSARVDR